MIIFVTVQCLPFFQLFSTLSSFLVIHTFVLNDHANLTIFFHILNIESKYNKIISV